MYLGKMNAAPVHPAPFRSTTSESRTATALPSTIAAVITALEGIMDRCAATGSRLGYFAALYHKVTCRVRDGIAAGEFADAPRMERLDVAFANRHIEAFMQQERGETPTQSWA